MIFSDIICDYSWMILHSDEICDFFQQSIIVGLSYRITIITIYIYINMIKISSIVLVCDYNPY